MTANARYEVMVIMFEFALSIVVLLGGGFLLYSGHSPEVAVSAITAVITFWFARRAAESSQKQLQQFTQSQQLQQPEAPTSAQPVAKPNPFVEEQKP